MHRRSKGFGRIRLAFGVSRRGLLSSQAAAGVLAMSATAAWANATGDAPVDNASIVVTAQRRSESIQQVPLSVTAVSGERLTNFGATGFSDYAVLAPDLSFGTGNGFGVESARQVTIRGIAGTNTTSFYINDTPVPLSLDPRVLDLSRVEVLRGPQGTLFGASSMGGTVRVITRPAQPGADQGFIDAQGLHENKGGFGYDVSGSYNVTLVPDQLALKVSAFGSYTPGIFTRRWGVSTTDGYGVPASQAPGEKKHVGDDSEFGGMVTLTWTPAALPGLTVTPMAIYQNMRGNGLPLADYDPHDLVQVRPLDVAEAVHDKWAFGALTAKYAAGFGEFISSTTYLHRDTLDNEDGTEAATVLFGGYATPPLDPVYQASPSPSWVKTRAFTEEARFQSDFKGPFQFIAGAFYNRTTSHTIQQEYTPYDGAGDYAFWEDVPRLNREIAGFLNVSLKPFKGLEVTAGVRRSHLTYHYAYVADGWINGGPSNSPTRHSENATTPRFTVKYQVTPTDTLYANAAKGYRVGGTNAELPAALCGADLAASGLPSGTISYKSDSLWSYEVGTKNSWFGGRVKTRLALYQIDWKKLQQSILLPCTYHVTLNAGSARSRGGELEADIAASNRLLMNIGIGYDDAKITKTEQGSNYVIGQPLNGVPKWTASFQGEYTVPTSFGSIFFRGQYTYTGSSMSFANDPDGRRRGAYSLVQLRTGAAKGPWTASLFVKNLFDVRANLGDEQSEISEMPDRPRWLVAQPRTVGIELRRTF